MVILPVSEGPAWEIREDLKKKLLSCDALILVYGMGTLAWVDMQLLNCKKITHKREQSFHALGIYDGPPEVKPNVLTRMPGLEIIDCREGLDKSKLNNFLAPLIESVAS